MQIKQIMETEYHTIPYSATVKEAAEFISGNKDCKYVIITTNDEDEFYYLAPSSITPSMLQDNLRLTALDLSPFLLRFNENINLRELSPFMLGGGRPAIMVKRRVPISDNGRYKSTYVGVVTADRYFKVMGKKNLRPQRSLLSAPPPGSSLTSIPNPQLPSSLGKSIEDFI